MVEREHWRPRSLPGTSGGQTYQACCRIICPPSTQMTGSLSEKSQAQGVYRGQLASSTPRRCGVPIKEMGFFCALPELLVSVHSPPTPSGLSHPHVCSVPLRTASPIKLDPCLDCSVPVYCVCCVLLTTGACVNVLCVSPILLRASCGTVAKRVL